MVVLQLVVASSMILLHLPPVLRSLHEATGVGIWLSCYALAYLAHRVAYKREALSPVAAGAAMYGARGAEPQTIPSRVAPRGAEL
jgi:hypothetical protein